MSMMEVQVTSDRPLGDGSDELKPATPPLFPTKHPGTDRAAILPSGGKQPGVPLQEAAAAADRAQLRATGDKAEQERLEIVTRFPITDWPTLPLERYALGLPESADGFCRWMEFNTHYLPSIKGGSALKHMIFKRQTGAWYFEKKYTSVEEAWTGVRAGFVDAFRLAGEGRFEEIGQVSAISAAISLSTKAVYCYFPDDLLPVCAGAHQEHFWKLLGGDGPITKGVPAARRLRELVRRTPVFDGWGTSEIMWFLYDWADPRQSQRIVKIAPGHDADLWEDCLANGYIRVGWDEVGDLREFETRDQFNAKFADAFSALYKGNGPKISEKAGEVWLLSELVPGDIVIANREPPASLASERSRTAATSTVMTWASTPTRSGWRGTRPRPETIDPIRRWAFKTVAKVSQVEYQRILKGRTNATLAAPPARRHRWRPSIRCSGRSPASCERKGQVILYGPPGTGKTYNARRFAVWWLNERRRGDPDAGASSPTTAAFRRSEATLSTAASEHRVWWVVANPTQWAGIGSSPRSPSSTDTGGFAANYPLVRDGDLVVGYQSTPGQADHGGGQDRPRAFTRRPRGDPTITLEPFTTVSNGPSYDELVPTNDSATASPCGTAARAPVRPNARRGRLPARHGCGTRPRPASLSDDDG